MPLRPRALAPGDRVALVSPASGEKQKGEIPRIVAALEELGLDVRTGRRLGESEDYLGGSDAHRLADLQRAFADPAIRAVFFLRGGYGSGRLLPGLDFAPLGRAPKLLVGFSDLTSILMAAWKETSLCSLHAPMGWHLAYAPQQPGPRLLFLRQLMTARPGGSLRETLAWEGGVTMRRGVARGRLIGGNLSVFVTLLGTPWLPAPRGRILFLEDVGEKPYRLDRMMTHLRNTGYLDRVAGIVLGQFTNCEPTSPDSGTAHEALARCLRGLKVPILAGIPVGHGRDTASLPFGTTVTLDAGGRDLILEEAPCKVR